MGFTYEPFAGDIIEGWAMHAYWIYPKSLELNVWEIFTRRCKAVVKGKRYSTFNSKDSRVVGSCILGASRAGFKLNSDGILYQPPIKAYQTTFHGIFVDSFIGDFILTFHKGNMVSSKNRMELDELKRKVDMIMGEIYQKQATERMTRERIYDLLLPFLGSHANDSNICMLATEYVEIRFRELNKYYSCLRKKIEKERRYNYTKKNRRRC